MQARDTYVERPLRSANGYLMFVVALGLFGSAIRIIVGLATAAEPDPWRAAPALGLVLLGVLCVVGLYMLQPNEAAIATLFGKYAGTDRAEGLRWANPFYIKRKISLRSRNLNSPPLKVNDKRGNPVEIGAAIVWRVSDTAQAVFEVDNVDIFVQVQAEAALRHLASRYAYDDGEDLAPRETTLRAGVEDVMAALVDELQARFAHAGVTVGDAKLTHLAYAPEIAQVMLRRQQAEAVISARHKIVQGAVAMVEAALTALSERNVVTLDDERKAAMVSNLLVVLCGDKDTQPIVNAGTLYN